MKKIFIVLASITVISCTDKKREEKFFTVISHDSKGVWLEVKNNLYVYHPFRSSAWKSDVSFIK